MDAHDGSRLLFAVPKKGRLYERVLKMLDGAGLEYSRPSRVDIANCTNLPITLVFLPAADIALYVGEGHVDIGITGEDIIAESQVVVNVLQPLGLGKCKLAVQGPVKDGIKDVKDLCGKRIVTSFPNLAKKYFEELNPEVTTNIKFVSGSVEAACSLGLADAVVDLVETGTTMIAAGLDIVSVIMTTETVLISNPLSKHTSLIKLLDARFKGKRLQMIQYNVKRVDLPKAVLITPGKRSPCVIPLDDAEWVAVSALVPKKGTSKIMDDLTEIGAQDILLFDLSNCRT